LINGTEYGRREKAVLETISNQKEKITKDNYDDIRDDAIENLQATNNMAAWELLQDIYGSDNVFQDGDTIYAVEDARDIENFDQPSHYDDDKAEEVWRIDEDKSLV
jgi:hypothetical protein